MSENKIVRVKEAVNYYMDGYKVRRFITNEMFFDNIEKQKALGKRVVETNNWAGTWVWQENGVKFCSNEEFTNLLLSPLESFTKFGDLDDTKLWEIKMDK